MNTPAAQPTPDLERVREVFEVVAALPAPERDAALASCCGGDAALAASVAALLIHHEPASDFLEAPAFAGIDLSGVSPHGEGAEIASVGGFEPGQVVGGFTIERLLGAGGMGMVYAARQHEPERRVALKVMRPGLASRSALRRFAQEGTALARLTHPGIALVYAAGVDRSPSGVLHPYLALEFIEGVQLSEHIADRAARTAERVSLFLQIADAVAHAHLRGVVHRDLKPANILVTAEGTTRVLDFGIARLLDDDEPHRLTRAGQIAGTLAYMSPEQLEGDQARIDVRTDVYALGVILYEMLSGRLPIDAGRSSLDKAAALIRSHSPEPLGKVDRALRGDLETIVAKALEKDPDRRYDSAAAFADDLCRWQRHEPIEARPAGPIYRAAKFFQRNRALAASALAIFLALSAGLGATLWQARLAEQAQRNAESRAEVARQTNVFLRDVFLAVDRARLRGREPTLRDAVNDAAERLDREPPASPLVEAEVRATIGRIYGMLGDRVGALAHNERALSLLDLHLGPSAPESLAAAATLASTLSMTGDARAAEQLVRARLGSMDARDAASLGAQARLMTVLAGVAVDVDDARRAGEEAADLAARIYGPEHEHTLAALSNLARALGRAGDWSDAEHVARQCLEIGSRTLAPDHPNRLRTSEELAAAVRQQGRVEESAALMEQVVAMGDRVVPVDHPEQLENRLSAASVLFRAGQHARAETVVRSAVPLAMQGDRHTPVSVRCLGFLCTILARQHRYEEAEVYAADTVAAAEAVFGAAPPGHDPPDGVIQAWTTYYNLYDRWEKPEQREQWRRKLTATATGKMILQMAGHGGSP